MSIYYLYTVKIYIQHILNDLWQTADRKFSVAGGDYNSPNFFGQILTLALHIQIFWLIKLGLLVIIFAFWIFVIVMDLMIHNYTRAILDLSSSLDYYVGIELASNSFVSPD